MRGDHDVVVRTRLAGICSTDLQLISGYKGEQRLVLGHEFVGDVVDAPAGSPWLGKRIVGEINIGCGRCEMCTHGLAKHCPHRQSIGIMGRDGAFAEYFSLPSENLIAVPDDLPDEAAVFTEPLAAALQVPSQVHLLPEMRVVVIGDGRLGQMIAQVLLLHGCDVTVSGRHATKLAILAELGARTHLAARGAADSPTDDRDLPIGADVVVEATGSSSGFGTAARLVRPGGTLVLKSTYAGEATPVSLSELVVNEITVIGSRCGPFVPALRLLAQGTIRTAPLVSARYSLQDGLQALAHAGQPGVLKVLLEP